MVTTSSVREPRADRQARSRRGATSIEYALIASMISVAIIGGVTLLSGKVQALFNALATAMP